MEINEMGKGGIPNFGIPPQDLGNNINKVGQSDQSLPATSQISATSETTPAQRPNPPDIGRKCDFTA